MAVRNIVLYIENEAALRQKSEPVRSEDSDAVLVHHELDHLDGVLFIDRVESVEELYRVVYCARRYGLEQAAVIEHSPGREPSPAEMAQVIETARRIEAKAIFAEPQFSP
jgi:ABC-type Zn2+ transport system substrate-binding protein/surface adhesin